VKDESKWPIAKNKNKKYLWVAGTINYNKFARRYGH